jgi:hypothetical protein
MTSVLIRGTDHRGRPVLERVTISEHLPTAAAAKPWRGPRLSPFLQRLGDAGRLKPRRRWWRW